MNTKQIKSQAMECLSKRWLKPFAVICIIFAVFIIAILAETAVNFYYRNVGVITEYDNIFSGNIYYVAVAVIRMLFGITVIAPAINGVVYWFIHFVRGDDNSINVIFVCYQNKRLYLKSILIQFILCLIVTVAVLPSLICGYFAYGFLQDAYAAGANNTVNVMLIICFSVLTICFAILGFIVILRFSAIKYIFALNSDIPIFKIFIMSFSIMKKHVKKIIKLCFSFVGWVIPGLLIFPLFFVVPYFAMSVTILMNSIIEKEANDEKNQCLRTPTKSSILRQQAQV